MYYVGTLCALMCNALSCHVMMDKIVVTHHSIQLCVNMETYNEQ